MQSNLLFTKQLYRRTKNVKSSDMRIWSQAMMATLNAGLVSTKWQTLFVFFCTFSLKCIHHKFLFWSSGFCWCVNSASGRPIPGTSLHNARPNCEAPTGGKEPFQIYLSTNLYPFHLVSDFGTEFILEPKMAFLYRCRTYLFGFYPENQPLLKIFRTFWLTINSIKNLGQLLQLHTWILSSQIT